MSVQLFAQQAAIAQLTKTRDPSVSISRTMSRLTRDPHNKISRGLSKLTRDPAIRLSRQLDRLANPRTRALR